MSAGKPDLVIPFRFGGIEEAIRLLRKLEQEGGNATKRTKGGLDEAGDSAKRFGGEMLSLIGLQSGLGMLHQAFGVVTQGIKEAAEYTEQTVKGFTELQKQLRIIATFKGEKLTDEFTVEQAKKGAAAGLTPQQWKDFEKEFTGYGGQFVGEGKKISTAQGDELEKRAASFMNARGIEASQGGAIFGEILQQAKGGESTDELMKKFGQAYVVLEQAKGDPGQLLGQIGEVTAQGVDVQTAAKLMRAMAQRNPGDAGVHGRATLRGLASLRTEGKAGELGITEDMDVFQQLEAINKKAPEDLKKREDFIRKYFKDEREFSGIMAGINFGVKGGLFAAADKEASGVTGRTDITAVDEFKKGRPGARLYTEAEKEAAKIENAEKWVASQDAKRQAEARLTGEHDDQGRNIYQKNEWKDLWRQTAGRVFGSRAEQVTYEEARGELEKQLPERDVKQARKESFDGGVIQDQNLYLKKLVELVQKQNQAQAARGKPALAAPPPQPRGRT